jgi:RNA polymerase sigma-70 factor, ECF subfamily
VNETQDRDSQLPETDERLMTAVALGSDEAFSALFERYKSQIFGYFSRRVVDRSQAEELTQDTFLAILEARARYQPSALFRTWLYAVALNILRAHRRKAFLRALFTGRAGEHHDPIAPFSLETELILREAVHKLESTDREILLLREFEQLNYAEIAAVLQIPINTVRSRLFRARAALRELLARPLPDQRQFTRAEEQS